MAGTISDASYQGSATGSLIISKAAPTITWATPAAISYGTALSSTQLNASANVAGSLAYSLAAGTLPNAGTQTLTATFTPTDTTNYATASSQQPLTVNKGTLAVTADNKSKTPGSANPLLTVTYSGFVNGDTASSLTTQPTATTTASQNSPVGTYAITVAGGVSPNYSFVYVAGVLSVTTTIIAPSNAVINITVE